MFLGQGLAPVVSLKYYFGLGHRIQVLFILLDK